MDDWYPSLMAANNADDKMALEGVKSGDLALFFKALENDSGLLSGDFGSHLLTDCLQWGSVEAINTVWAKFPSDYLWAGYDKDTHGPFCSITPDGWAFSSLSFDRLTFLMGEKIVSPSKKANYGSGARSDILGAFINQEDTLFSMYMDVFKKNHQGNVIHTDAFALYETLRNMNGCLPYYPIDKDRVKTMKERLAIYFNKHIALCFGEDPKGAFSSFLQFSTEKLFAFSGANSFFREIQRRVLQNYPAWQEDTPAEYFQTIKNLVFLKDHMSKLSEEQALGSLKASYFSNKDKMYDEGIFKATLERLRGGTYDGGAVSDVFDALFGLNKKRGVFPTEEQKAALQKFELWLNIPLSQLLQKSDKKPTRKI